MSEFYMKALTKEDWKSFRDIRIDMVTECPGYFLESSDQAKARSEQEWKDRLSAPISRLFGFYLSNQLVGLIGIFSYDKLPPECLKIGMLYIRPSYRGKGLCKSGYRACLDYAYSLKDFSKVIVSHREGNAASRAAILAAGFTQTTKTRKLFGDECVDFSCNYELEISRPQNE